MNRPRTVIARLGAAALAAALLGPAAITAAAPATAAPALVATADTGEDSGAPHSPIGRRPAPLRVKTTGAAVVRDVDLGDITLGRYRTPVRGLLVTPRTHPKTGAPLIVVSHLRTASCSGHVYGYPCPAGTHELRMDRGMSYLAQSLAARGHAVLVPDVSGAWMGSGLSSPYDERAMWTSVVKTMRDRVASDVAGRTHSFGPGMRGAVDLRSAGLFVHSRSGYAIPVAAKALGPTRLGALLAYGPAYDVPGADGRFSPASPDVPYLALVGEEDHDVPFNAHLLLSHHLAAPRRTPALVAVVPGLGHSYINRTLSSAHDDDRICEDACPDAAAHERFLTTVAADFYDATLRGRRTSLPLRADTTPTATLSGLPVRWLAATPAPAGRVVALTPNAFRPTPGGTVVRCDNVDPMNPDRSPTACPEPESGAIVSMSRVAHTLVAPGKGATATTRVANPRMLAVHVAPWGSRTDHADGTPLHVVVRLADGRRWVGYLFRKEPALRNRETTSSNGSYLTTTMRVALPRWVQRATLTSVTVEGGPAAPSWIDLRQVDILH